VKDALLGHDYRTGEPVRVPKKAFDTHFHFIGGTGKGKTTAIHTLLRPLLRDPTDRSCFIIIDRLGNLSEELLIWMASEDFCSDYVRERLVYIQPSREDVVLPFNPLLYDTLDHGFYRIERTTEIILRAWESTNIEAMPRLARWTFNSFWAAARLGLTVSDAEYLLLPGTDLHNAIMRRLPDDLRAEWKDIYSTQNRAETSRILDSTRNRLKPFFESGILRRMFGSVENRLDVASLMREGKIVLIDLAPRNRLASQLANTIGGLMLNEILETARCLPRLERYPTYLFLDEFQNFVGPDIEDALPEVRQLGIKFLLSHQSMSQLERGPYDLTQMIFQAQSRMVFGVQGEDADLLAHELASITFDPDRIKDQRYTKRQLVRGHRKIELNSRSDSSSSGESASEQYGESSSRNTGEVQPPYSVLPTKSKASARGENKSRGQSRESSHSSTLGTHESLVPEYENFEELASTTYRSFEEQRSIWARDVRNLRTGQALVRLVDDPRVRLVDVKRSATSYLRHDLASLARHFPELLEKTQALIEANFQRDIFLPAPVVDRQIEQRLGGLLNGPVVEPVIMDAAGSPFA
jgi:TraM recognition site of TraD and TraG/Helicase HerA, central domain